MTATKKKKATVAILMGSASDWPTMKECATALQDFGITADIRVLSAHRTPREASEFVASAERRGIKVIIAAAGMAAHLAGAAAAHTSLPVLGVPMKGGAVDGLDALLSTAQMPPGVPVATFAIGNPGAVNAAIFAVQILALSDRRLRTKLRHYKQNMRRKVLKADRKIQAEQGD